MAIKKILLYPNPLLLRESTKIETFDESLVSLSRDLIDTNDCKIVINPQIEYQSEEMGSYKEGCLSIPGITEEISRPKVIKVLYQDINGVMERNTYDDLWSTCFQHELDHLNGKLFIDHLRPMKKILVKNKMKKSSKKEKKE